MGHDTYENNQTKCKVIYEMEPSDVVSETERQLDQSRNSISHVGFSENWARQHGQIVYEYHSTIGIDADETEKDD